ncbi:MAG: glycine zipper domain-containing protein [Prevotella sp.]|jgi:outer membrane lipoprotein SlyB
MRKSIVLAVAATMLLTGCDSYTGQGAYTGTMLGSILGSAIGGISDGPRGSDIGTIVGMAGGAVVGGVIGQAADQRRQADLEQYRHDKAERVAARTSQQSQSNYDSEDYVDNGTTNSQTDNYGSGFDSSNSGDDRIYDFNSSDYTGNYSAQQPKSNLPMESSVEDVVQGYSYTPNVVVRNARFVDDNQNGTLERGEMAKIIFEVMNTGQKAVYDVQPTVVEATGNRHIFISPNMHVEKIMPGKGIRYTALVKADDRLKQGSVKFCVSVLVGNKAISKVTEFNIPTRKY